MKYLAIALSLVFSAFTLSACLDTDASVASSNISQDADNFKVPRRILFINTWTGEYIQEIIGYCSSSDKGNRVVITCKDQNGGYKNHFLGLNGNATYSIQQLEASMVSTKFYKVTFKPTTVLPMVEMR